MPLSPIEIEEVCKVPGILMFIEVMVAKVPNKIGEVAVIRVIDIVQSFIVVPEEGKITMSCSFRLLLSSRMDVQVGRSVMVVVIVIMIMILNLLITFLVEVSSDIAGAVLNWDTDIEGALRFASSTCKSTIITCITISETWGRRWVRVLLRRDEV